MGEMLTSGQVCYLLAIEQVRERDRSTSRLAEILEVSKPSVTNMITALEEKEMIEKGPPLKLTARGKSLANKIKNNMSLLLSYFSQELEQEAIANDVLSLMMSVSDSFISKLIYKIEMDEARSKLKPVLHSVHLTSFKGILSEGVYDMPFRLLKVKDHSISMGDKGLQHLARLVLVQEHGVITLRPATIKSLSRNDQMMKGRIARLFYWNGERFVEVLETKGGYVFPIMGMHWRCDPKKKMDFGVIQLKIFASVGSFNMPESIAEMAIYLE